MGKKKEQTVHIGSDESGLRIDVALSRLLPGQSRNSIQRLIREGMVTLNGRPVKAGQKAEEGWLINLTVPPPQEVGLEPENLPLSILFEDKDLIVVNKPPGMVTHPGPGNRKGTLVNALLFHCRDLSGLGGKLRPGIVHRLDKGTSGVMVVAKNDQAHRHLSLQFKKHAVAKAYLVVVWDNIVDDEGSIELPIGRDRRERKKISPRTTKPRMAFTSFRVVRRFGYCTLLEAYPRTGRTHQIRVHLAHIKHPVVGDTLYGRRKERKGLPHPWLKIFQSVDRSLLHSYRLSFKHPADGRPMDFTAPPPPDFDPFMKNGDDER